MDFTVFFFFKLNCLKTELNPIKLMKLKLFLWRGKKFYYFQYQWKNSRFNLKIVWFDSKHSSVRDEKTVCKTKKQFSLGELFTSSGRFRRIIFTARLSSHTVQFGSVVLNTPLVSVQFYLNVRFRVAIGQVWALISLRSLQRYRRRIWS